MIYLLDSNVLSLYMRSDPGITPRFSEALDSDAIMGLCLPVYYEIRRGLLARGATAQAHQFRQEVIPILNWIPLEEADWEQAAAFWSDARRRGWQLSDVDLLLAAIAHRLDAVIVTEDNDFNALPVRRENWRQP